jgi:hypothetical protein
MDFLAGVFLPCLELLANHFSAWAAGSFHQFLPTPKQLPTYA